MGDGKHTKKMWLCAQMLLNAYTLFEDFFLKMGCKRCSSQMGTPLRLFFATYLSSKQSLANWGLDSPNTHCIEDSFCLTMFGLHDLSIRRIIYRHTYWSVQLSSKLEHTILLLVVLIK